MKLTTIFLIPLVVLGLAGGYQLKAQDDASKKGGKETEPKILTITGCLALSEDPGIAQQYVVKSANISHPLEPGAEDLSVHVGHKVTITGTSMKGPHDEDRIRVTKVMMISTTCLP